MTRVEEENKIKTLNRIFIYFSIFYMWCMKKGGIKARKQKLCGVTQAISNLAFLFFN